MRTTTYYQEIPPFWLAQICELCCQLSEVLYPLEFLCQGITSLVMLLSETFHPPQ